MCSPSFKHISLFWKEVVSGRALIGLRSGRPVEICCPLFVLVKSLFDLWIECEGDLGGRQVIFTPFNFGFHHWNIKKGVAYALFTLGFVE